ncbi:MAG: protein phosphatase 2C domain-containing protein [Propionibacteriaceae bacterium]|jgi:serine/threonine protein phosphatase PrpC|nr:protein phosphatase 2C domain-containing protein [Propionibacteriaceae bacterium]
MTLELRVFAHSEIGLVRKNNQDSGYASPTMLMVADGMGGAAAGDLASRIAIDELRGVDGQGQGDEMLDILDEATHRANDRLAVMIEADHELDGMGTTVCGGLFDGADLGLVHIGDSRAYLVRGQLMIRLTHDHSWVQSLIDEGKLTEAEAFTHPHRSLLLRVLNGQPYSRPDLLLVSLRDGDRVMFCSDGLCGLVDDPAIARGLALPDPKDALKRLIEIAHRAGASDNITIILADVFETGQTPAGQPLAAPAGQVAVTGATAAIGAAATSASASQPDPAGQSSSVDSAGQPSSVDPLSQSSSVDSASPVDSARPLSPASPVGSASPFSPASPASPVGSAHSPDSASPGESAPADRSSLSQSGAALTTAGPDSPVSPLGPDRAEAASGQSDVARSAASPAQTAPPTSPNTPVNPDVRSAPTVPPPRPAAQLRAGLLAGDPVQAKGRRVGRGVLIGAAAQIAPLDGPQAVLTSPAVLVRPTSPPSRLRPPRRHRRWGLVVALAAILVALVVAVVVAGGYVRSQYFVSAADQRVAIYQGLPGDVLGLSTSRVQETTDIDLADLPLHSREDVVAGIVIRQGGLDQAHMTVAELRSLSHQCLQRRTQRQEAAESGAASVQVPDDGC